MTRSFSVRRVGVLAAVLCAIAGVVAWHYGLFGPILNRARGNSIMVIAPYRYTGAWVFDDPSSGLVREPFVGTANEMIDALVADIPDADTGFRLYFSVVPFPGHQKKLTWLRGGDQGNWYKLDDPPLEGWLCPALFKYYRKAPKELYVRAEAKK